ncbi:amidohydrolase [Tatumella punctata]|uniref:Amidohydrolase n=1 Tax=Tatumella punctata TaxID=399969 RepID=A0ABW1VM21_9GAMM
MSRTLQHFSVLHEIPELGFEEFKTSAYIASALETAGFNVTRNINGTTGIIAELDSDNPGPVLALRADMDALGHIIDGQHVARHTCGHDGHSSVVLTAAEEILREGLVRKGKLRILFQPAEELGTGAIAMVEGGALENVDMLLGFHLRPVEECPMGQAVAAMYYSASATVEAVFTGKAAHAARPHLGVNALDAAVQAVQAVNSIHLSPSLTFSAKATRFLCDAGVTNSIPSEARVCWDLRSAENAPMDELKQKVTAALQGSAAALGASVEISILKQMPAAILDEDATGIISQAICQQLGEAALQPARTTPGSEDFFHYLRLCPQVKGGFWGLGANLTPGLHHPDMHFDHDALAIGVRIFKSCVRQVLGE